MDRPLIPLLLSYLSGLLLAPFFPIPPSILIPGLALVLLSCIYAVITRAHRSFLILCLTLFALIGMLSLQLRLTAQRAPSHITHYLKGEKVVVEGVLYNPPEHFTNRTRLYIRAEQIIERNKITSIKGTLLLTIQKNLYAFNYGDRVRLSAKLRLPRNYNNPGGFDYQRYLALQGIQVTASLRDGTTIVKTGTAVPNPLVLQGELLRGQIRTFLTRKLTSPEADIARALLLGEKGVLDPGLREQFSITGVAHILAISGLHIGIIALVSFFLFKRLLSLSTWIILATDISKVAALLTLLPVVAYWFVAGYGTGTTRATVMVITYLMATAIGKQEDVWNTLALAACIILTWSPTALFDISFQLSFISVMAILYFTPRFAPFLMQESPDPLAGTPPRWKKITRKTALFLLVNGSAVAGTAPLVAFYFHRFSPWGWLGNLIIIPLVGFLVVPLGLLTSLLVFLFQPLAAYTVQLMGVLIRLAGTLVNCLAGLPYADYRTTTPTGFEIGLFYLGMVCLATLKKSSRAYYGLLLVALGLALDYGFWYYQNQGNPHLRITALDVGQGESTLLQLPHGKTMLIDGGGSYNNSFDLGEKVVAPALWKKKIRHIDVVVISHPHPDHLNGLIYILNHFSVDEVWTNGEEGQGELFAVFERTIAQKGIRKRVLSKGAAPITINGVAVEVLHPPPAVSPHHFTDYSTDINNRSLVMRFTYKGITLLFTGDISRAVEAVLVQNAPCLSSTILKVPHHGSATSSSRAFLKKVQPHIALLSVGYENSFHLPHPEVMRRYQEQGCKLLRTDLNGAIEIETDGSALRLTTFLP